VAPAVRNLASTFALLSLGALSACSSTVTPGTGGGSAGTGSPTSSSTGTAHCVSNGDTCNENYGCCDGTQCVMGTCKPCYVAMGQCMCGGVGTGADCNGDADCNLDPDADAGADGGAACACVQVTQETPCD
jgi:hypothetical protein